VKLALSVAIATLMLAGCGGATDSAAKSGKSPTAGKAAGAPAPVTAQGETADDLLDEEGGEVGVNELLGVLEDLPTQDELDAAAAERINEESAEAEYERLKAEIEQDLADPPTEDAAEAK
jgi:hypothetical protein